MRLEMVVGMEIEILNGHHGSLFFTWPIWKETLFKRISFQMALFTRVPFQRALFKCLIFSKESLFKGRIWKEPWSLTIQNSDSHFDGHFESQLSRSGLYLSVLGLRTVSEHTCVKRDLHTSKRPIQIQKRPTKETHWPNILQYLSYLRVLGLRTVSLHMHVKKDLRTSKRPIQKETYKRDPLTEYRTLFILPERVGIEHSVGAHVCQKKPTTHIKETIYTNQRDLQKRPIDRISYNIYPTCACWDCAQCWSTRVSKETYTHQIDQYKSEETCKRDLHKRPTKETYKRDQQKRPLQIWRDMQKRPTKETNERDLHTSKKPIQIQRDMQKRPITRICLSIDRTSKRPNPKNHAKETYNAKETYCPKMFIYWSNLCALGLNIVMSSRKVLCWSAVALTRTRNALQRTATHCDTLQHTCNTLQHTATCVSLLSALELRMVV